MNRHATALLIVTLALIVTGTGFVRADLQLCRTRCEYSALNLEAPPPCCPLKQGAVHAAPAGHHGAEVPDCPHIDSKPEAADSLTFLASANTLPTPPRVAAFAAFLPPAVPAGAFRFAGWSTRTGLPPPDLTFPPAYRLNCTLLI
ncbi:MAG: hypothetical protein RBR09_11700 [Desulfobulbaceae bacterium]|nr:hypothetical protein [Desulfobulbaceae bacterium]MDY0351910.1 hypothetical protein [Desulfobulbaceae bacterium]